MVIAFDEDQAPAGEEFGDKPQEDSFEGEDAEHLYQCWSKMFPSAGVSSRPNGSLKSALLSSLCGSPSNPPSAVPRLSPTVESAKVPSAALSSTPSESAAPSFPPSSGPSCFPTAGFNSAEWVAYFGSIGVAQ